MTELVARLPRTWPRVSTAAILAIAVACGALYLRALSFRGEVLPGTSVAGVELGGLDRAEAIAAVEQAVAPELRRKLHVDVGPRTVDVGARELFALDAAATVDAALAQGRATEPARFAVLVGLREHAVDPVLTVRRQAAVALVKRVRRIGARAPRSAGVEMRGLEPVVTAAVAGRALDTRALLADLERVSLHGGNVTATFTRAEPRLTIGDAQVAADTARALVAAPVYVFYDDRPLATLEPEQLASIVAFLPRADELLVTFDPEGLAKVLKPAIGVHERAPIDARFQVVGERVRVVGDRPGLGLDVDAALGEITAAAYAPERRIANVAVHRVEASVTKEDLRGLGISRQISTFTTDMGVSSSNRIWNVQLMARYIDGTIIKPGDVFSFNRVVGKRTVERGFREGQMIVGSLLLPSIGGGVCQTATTLFNNAFELGLPVQRRYNHSFYISHYPMGRDATVSWGGPDLVFKNDLKHAILIKSSYTSSTLTFTFYGTPQGRRIVATTSPQTNWRAPQTSYAYDPYAPAGSVRTSAGTNQSGFDVTVSRTVYERGEVLRRDAFKSRYIPVGPTVVYGPGTNPPRVDFTLPPPE